MTEHGSRVVTWSTQWCKKKRKIQFYMFLIDSEHIQKWKSHGLAWLWNGAWMLELHMGLLTVHFHYRAVCQHPRQPVVGSGRSCYKPCGVDSSSLTRQQSTLITNCCMTVKESVWTACDNRWRKPHKCLHVKSGGHPFNYTPVCLLR